MPESEAVTPKYDPAIYPRKSIDEAHVKTLVEALKAGATFPPIVCLTDGRILDGVHRFHAHQQVGTDPDFEVVDIGDDEALFESAVLNATHGKRLDRKELQAVVLRYWTPEWEGKHGEAAYEKRAARLGVTPETLRNWTRDLRNDHKEQQRMDAVRRYEAGETQAEIAKALNVHENTVANWLKEHEATKSEKLRKLLLASLRPYTIWNFSSCSPLFGMEYPGRLPGELIGNVVHWFTEEGDLVVDPMAGGGTTHDVCEALNRRCVCFDLVPARPFIVEHDLSKGLPAQVAEADLVFLDPPYFSMKRGAYSDHATNLANLDLGAFFGQIDMLAEGLFQAMKPGAKVACIIADQTGKDLPEGRPIWSGLECANRFRAVGFLPVAMIDAPLSQDSLQPQQITNAKETKQLLGLTRWLFVVEKPDGKATGSPVR